MWGGAGDGGGCVDEAVLRSSEEGGDRKVTHKVKLGRGPEQERVWAGVAELSITGVEFEFCEPPERRWQGGGWK